MIPKPMARRVTAAARRFQDREPWLAFTDENLIAVEIPGEPRPAYAIVLGAAGKEFGLSMYFGERALEQVQHITLGPRPPFVAPTLLLSFDPVGAVAPEFRELARLGGTNERVIPVVMSIPVGGKVRRPSTADLRLVAQIVEAMLLAEDADILRPRTFDFARGGKVLTLAIQGEAGKVDGVTARYVVTAPPSGTEPIELSLPWPLPELPLLDTHHVVAFEPMPVDIANESNRPWLLLVVDPAADKVVDLQVVPLEQPDDLENAAHEFARICANPRLGDAGLPKRLTFTNDRLATALAGLADRGVAIDVVDEHPSTQQVLAGLRGHLAGEAADGSTLPSADDQARWIEHHRRLTARLAEQLETVDLYSRKAVAAFFGDPDVVEELDDENMALHRSAYRDWYVTNFRGKAGRRTIAERLLAGQLPAAERCLLEARTTARTGLYVVARRQPPIVLLRDVLTDHEVEVHDGNLATSVHDGAGLPARIADAQGHRFVLALGPMVPALQMDAALAELHESLGAFTSAELQTNPEMLACLWSWTLDEHARMRGTRLTNSDGEEMAAAVATFRVADWARLTHALTARADIEADGEGRWDWLRRNGGETTELASLERVVDELLVEVNSASRLEAVRAWLETVPGVAFVSARGPDLADDAPYRDRDGIDPSTLSPESLAELQAHLDTHAMRWLDERVPMLGHRTPREAVRTAEGRETVLRLIRSWPDPGGIPGLRTPRERLRRELGLADPGDAVGGGGES